MHQRSSLSVTPASTRRALQALSLSALAYLSGCNGEAYNLGEDEPAGEEESTCNVDISSSGNIFAENQAEVDALSGCRQLAGSLYIRVPQEEQATFSLAALSELELVDGLLSIVGPLESLGGLESLEEIGSLELEGLRVAELTPLAGLRAMRGLSTDVRSRGAIRITDCDELNDLSGLDNLTIWSSLHLYGLDNLVTLDGLHAPPLVEGIDISQAPRLADVSGLASVREAGGFNLSFTALRTLGDLGLRTAEYIGIYENDALTDLDGLRNVQAVSGLSIENNDALLRIELPSLADFTHISIVDNAALRAVPHYQANTGSWWAGPVGVATNVGRQSRVLFEVGGNPQVQSIVLPTDYTDLQQVAIYENSSLTTLDMGNLQRSTQVWIQNNAVLGSVAAPFLARVDELSLLNNPALSVASFANVQTFEREVTGNLDELAP